MDGWWAISYGVLWLLVIALCVVIVALARQIGTLHLRLGPRGALEMDIEGPPLDEAPEAVELAGIDGERVTIGGPEQGQLLLFVSPGCHLCEQVLPGVETAARAGGLTPYVLTDASTAESRSAFASGAPVPVVPGIDVARSYEIPGTPYVVILDDTGVVRAKGTPNNLEQMEGLVDTARRRIDEAHAARSHGEEEGGHHGAERQAS